MATDTNNLASSGVSIGDETSRSPWIRTFAAIVTTVALLVFFALVFYLLFQVGVEDPAWTRYVYLLTGVETIAFAGVGWLFGREVHRAQVQSAEQRAENAVKSKDQAQQEKSAAEQKYATERTKGETFATAVYSLLSGQGTADAKATDGEQWGLRAQSGSPAPSSAHLAALADMAAKLYPDVVDRRRSS